jgi:hypothetical protein
MKRYLNGYATLMVLPLTALLGCIYEENADPTWWTYCDSARCYACDSVGCEPLPGRPDNVTCTNPRGCPTTGCPADGGTCGAASRPCSTAKPCQTGYQCSDSVCVPKPAEPPARPQCTQGGDCANGLCLDGRCATADGNAAEEPRCETARHCGTDRTCFDGQCVNRCQDSGQCGSGQVCKAGACVTDAAAPSCLLAAQCGEGEVCLNGGCRVDCSASAVCAKAADICTQAIHVDQRAVRLCRPDPRLGAPDCTRNHDCGVNELCVDGTCRKSCAATATCTACADAATCVPQVFCLPAAEAKPDCRLSGDCAAGKGCLDGRCVAL